MEQMFDLYGSERGIEPFIPETSSPPLIKATLPSNSEAIQANILHPTGTKSQADGHLEEQTGFLGSEKGVETIIPETNSTRSIEATLPPSYEATQDNTFQSARTNPETPDDLKDLVGIFDREKEFEILIPATCSPPAIVAPQRTACIVQPCEGFGKGSNIRYWCARIYFCAS